MNTIEIKVTTNGLETGQAAALANFLTSLNVDTTSEATELKKDIYAAWDQVEEKQEEVKKPRQRAKKEKTAPVEEVEVIEPETVEPEPTEEEAQDEPQPEPTEEEAQDEPQPEPDTTAAIPTLMQIRAVVSEKAQKSDELKTALRDKLKSFGVTNVSSLGEENWAAFYEFANAL